MQASHKLMSETIEYKQSERETTLHRRALMISHVSDGLIVTGGFHTQSSKDAAQETVHELIKK